MKYEVTTRLVCVVLTTKQLIPGICCEGLKYYKILPLCRLCPLRGPLQDPTYQEPQMPCHDYFHSSVRGIASLIDLSTSEEILVISVGTTVEKAQKVARQVVCLAKWCGTLVHSCPCDTTHRPIFKLSFVDPRWHKRVCSIDRSRSRSAGCRIEANSTARVRRVLRRDGLLQWYVAHAVATNRFCPGPLPWRTIKLWLAKCELTSTMVYRDSDILTSRVGQQSASEYRVSYLPSKRAVSGA